MAMFERLDVNELHATTQYLNGTQVPALTTAASSVAGQVQASKALVADSNKAIDALRTQSIRVGASGSEKIVPTAATITVGSITSHACPVTVQLKDSAGNNVDSVKVVEAWISDTAGGADGTAGTSAATVASTAVILREEVTKAGWRIATTATGSFVITLTQSATQNSYLNVLLPTGSVVSSAVIAFP